MRARLVAIGVAALGLVAVGLTWIGMQVLDRDRRDMYRGFAEDRRHRLEAAALDLGNDVERIGEDLALAAALGSRSASQDVFERELGAIVAIKREYLAIDVRDLAGATIAWVGSPDADAATVAGARATVDEVARAAAAAPGRLKTSRPVGARDPAAAWLRVFARQSLDPGRVTIAVIVDMRPLLDRLRLLSDDTSALLIVGAHGKPAPASHPGLAEAVRTLSTRRDELDGLARLIESIEGRRAGSVLLDDREAVAIGLPDAVAVGVSVPVVIEDGEPWALALVASTQVLAAQERRLVRRVLIGGSFALALLVALAAYFVRNARRAATLQERLRQADRLAHLTEKAEKILDHIPSGVLALGLDRTVTASNRWLSEQLGRDVTGAALAEVFAGARPRDVDRVDRLIEAATASAEPQAIRRARLSLLGDDRDLSVHAIPLERRLSDVHVLLVIEDDTQVRRLEDRLLHSEKLATAGQLAAGIAHEIGTPLNIARGRAELAAAKLGDAHPQAAAQRIIVEQIDHVSGLITQLLDFVRPRPPAIAAVDAGAAARATAELLAAEAAKRQVRLDAEIDPDTPAVRADPDQLRQVLVNLAVNSLDASRPGGRIALRVRPSPRRHAVVLEVDDDGAGIGADHRAQVFDPFFTTKKRGQGTGLGLWVVATVLQSHDAEIELTSDPGWGTTVRITWPAARPPSTTA
jgi:two-component system, NtrC family, sensor histidine kinase HydH